MRVSLKASLLVNSSLLLALASVAFLGWLKISYMGYISFRPIDIVIILSTFLAFPMVISRPNLLHFNPIPAPLGLALSLYLFLLIIFPIIGILIWGAETSNILTSLRFFILSAFLIWLLFASRNSPSFEDIFRKCMTYFLGISAIYAILQILEFTSIIPPKTLPHHAIPDSYDIKHYDFMRPNAFFPGPNSYGWANTMGIIVSFPFILKKERQWYPLFIICIFGVALSTSRSALFSSVLAVFTMAAIHYLNLIAKKPNRGIAKLAKAIFYTLIAFSIFFLMSEFFGIFRVSGIIRGLSVISGDLSADGSFSARLDMWKTTILETKRYLPVGYGGDPVEVTGGHAIDSAWLSHLVQGGVFLVTAKLLLLVALTKCGFKFYFSKNNSNPFGLSLIGFSISIFFGNFVLTPFHFLFTIIVLFTLISLFSSRNTWKNRCE